MSFDLNDVRSVKLADEGTRRDVNEFARATASARRRDAKTIVVTSDGAGAGAAEPPTQPASRAATATEPQTSRSGRDT